MVVSIADIARQVAGTEGSSRQRTERLVQWLNNQLEWVATDYQDRSVAEILERRAGNCADQAKVLRALLDGAAIRNRWIAEINIHPRDERREAFARSLVERMGPKASVFGLMHNDHQWLEFYDDEPGEWAPADATLGLVGTPQWVEARLGFGVRPQAARAMIAPFGVAVVEGGVLKESRSQHYLFDQFDKVYGGKLSGLSAWAVWQEVIGELAPLAEAAFEGRENLHERVHLMGRLVRAYGQLKVEALRITAH